MASKEQVKEMNMNGTNSRGWLGVGVFLLAALALPACTHRHIHTAGPPAHAPAHGYHRHGIHSARVVGLRITFIAVGGRVIVLADGTYVNQHGHYIIISGGYVHELGGIPPGQIVAASRRRGPRHGYPPGHSKVKFKVKKVKMHGGRLSFIGPDGGTVVFPGGIYRNKRGHQIIVDDGHVRTLVLAAKEPSRAATPSSPGAGRPSRADRRPARADERPSRADRRPTAAQPIEHGVCWKTEIRGDVATRKVIPCPDNPKAPATKPAIKKTRTSRPDARPTRADRRPAHAEERLTRDTGRSDRSNNTSSARRDARPTNTGTSRRPASSAERTSESSKRGAAPAGRGTAQGRKPAAEPSKRVSGKQGCKESSEQSKSGSSRGSSKKKPCKESSEQGTSDSSQGDSKKKESKKKD